MGDVIVPRKLALFNCSFFFNQKGPSLCVVRFHHCSGDLWATPHSEGNLALLAVVHRQTFQHQTAQARSSATTASIVDTETLQTWRICSKQLAWTRVYPSSYDHGSGKRVPPTWVAFHLGYFSTSMIMGEKVLKMKLCQGQHPGKKLLLDAKKLFAVTPASVHKKKTCSEIYIYIYIDINIYICINQSPQFNKKGQNWNYHLNVIWELEQAGLLPAISRAVTPLLGGYHLSYPYTHPFIGAVFSLNFIYNKLVRVVITYLPPGIPCRKTGAIICELADTVQDQIHDLLADGVMPGGGLSRVQGSIEGVNLFP